MADDIDRVRAARDQQLEGLDVAFARVNQEIAAYTQVDDYQGRLIARQTELLSERAAVRSWATNQVLALASVLAAVNRLAALGDQMSRQAKQMQTTTRVLSKSAEILGISKKFLDLVVEKKSEGSSEN